MQRLTMVPRRSAVMALQTQWTTPSRRSKPRLPRSIRALGRRI